MTPLTCLIDLLPSHLDEEPRREQRAWLDGREPIVLQVTLQRTAIMRRLPDVGFKELVAKDRIYVDAEALVWVPEGSCLWDSLDGRHLKGGPSMRERRLRGRVTALRNKAAKEQASNLAPKPGRAVGDEVAQEA